MTPKDTLLKSSSEQDKSIPEQTTSSKGLGRRSILYVLGDALNKGLAFLLIPLYAHALTLAEYGILGIVVTLTSIFGMLFLDPMAGATNRLYFDEKSEEAQKRLFSTAWIGLLLWGGGLLLLFELLGPAIFAWLFRAISYEQLIRPVVWSVFFLNCFVLPVRSWLIVRERAFSYCFVNTSLFLLHILFIFYAVVVLKQGIVGNLYAILLGSFILAVACGVYLIRVVGWQFSPGILRRLLSFSLPILPHALALWLLNLSDRIILERYASLQEVGVYTLGYQLGQGMNLVAVGAMNALTPYYYRVVDAPDGRDKIAKIFFYFSGFLAYLLLCVSVLASEVIQVLAKPGYQKASLIAPWIGLAFFFRVFYFQYLTALYYKKRVFLIALITIVLASFQLLANLWSIPRWGYWGATASTVLFFGLHAWVVQFFAQRVLSIKFQYRRLARLVAVFISFYGVSFWVELDSVWWTIVAKLLLLLSCPLFLVLIRFYTPEEKVVLLKHWKSSFYDE